MNRDMVRQAINVVALLLTVAANGLANALPLNGQTTGEISDRFPIYFVPAGYVFSIWGVIYLGLAAFVIYQALPAQRSNPRLRRIGPWFALSCAANTAWIFGWHYEQFPLTQALIVALLLTLIVIYRRLDIGGAAVPRAERWLVQVPFSIYLGWVTVATVANASVVLYNAGWSGWGISAAAWAVIMLAAALLIGLAMSLRRGDVAYLIVLVWAFVGIGVKQAATPLVAYAAGVAALVAVALLVVAALRTRQQGRLMPRAA